MTRWRLFLHKPIGFGARWDDSERLPTSLTSDHQSRQILKPIGTTQPAPSSHFAFSISKRFQLWEMDVKHFDHVRSSHSSFQMATK